MSIVRGARSRGGNGREDGIFAGTIGFLVREVMSVPRRNAIMRLAADRQGGRYVNQSSIRRKDTDGNEKLSQRIGINATICFLVSD